MRRKKTQEPEKKPQIRRPMEAKEIIDNALFYPSTRGAKLPKREIDIILNETTGVKVVSDLNQSHRNILDTIMALAYRNNAFVLSNNEHEVDIYYACRWSDLYAKYGRNSGWIIKHVEDIMRTFVALHTEKNGIKNTRIAGLVPEYGFLSTQKNYGNSGKEEVKEALQLKRRRKKPNPNWFKPKEGDIFWIKISFAWFVLMQFSRVRVNYSLKMLDKLLKEPGIIQSAIMFITAQQAPFRIGAETLLNKMKPDWDKLSRWTKYDLFAMLKKNIDTFKEYNIDYDSDKQLFSYYIPYEGVGFSKSVPKLKDGLAKQVEQYLTEDSKSQHNAIL